MAAKAGTASEPPMLPRGCDRHHDQHRQADADEDAAEREPAGHHPLEIAELGDVVTAVPPQLRQAEGKLSQPHQRQAQHRQQHSGADPPGRRLTHEAGAASRVEHEHRHQHECGQDQVHAGNARSRLHARCLHCQERVRVQLSRAEVARHVGRPGQAATTAATSAATGTIQRAAGSALHTVRPDAGIRSAGRRSRVQMQLPARRGPAVRIAVAEQIPVARGLGVVAKLHCAEVAKPPRTRPRTSA